MQKKSLITAMLPPALNSRNPVCLGLALRLHLSDGCSLVVGGTVLPAIQLVPSRAKKVVEFWAPNHHNPAVQVQGAKYPSAAPEVLQSCKKRPKPCFMQLIND